MKPTAATRLAAAIASMQIGIYNYCKTHAETAHPYGLCVIRSNNSVYGGMQLINFYHPQNGGFRRL